MTPAVGSVLVGMKFAEIQKRYNSDDLAQDLSGGFRDILAGVGGDYLLTVDSVNGFITLADKNVIYGTDGDGISAGAMASGKNAPAIALTAAGIAMGYNRPSDGHWVNAVTIESDGNAAFSGTIRASEIIAGTVIAGGVTIAGASGDKTLDQIIAGTGYTAEQLQTDLAAGVGNIVAGVGSDYQMLVDTTNNYIAIGRVGAVFKGNAVPGINRPTIGLSAAGLAMGYNRASDGAWVDSVAIDASGNASFSGSINATSGNFTGTLNVGSVIAGGVTVNGTSMLTIQNGAAAGSTAVQPAALANYINKNAANVLSGTISPASGVANSGAFKIGSITWDVSGIVTGGSGIAITANGIVGAKNGLTSFSVDTSGNAYFKGDITGSNGAFYGTVSAANLTAGTITARVSMNSAGSINATGVYGSILGNVAIVGAPTQEGHGVAGIAFGIMGNAGVYGKANSVGYGVYSAGKIGTDSSALVANLNANYFCSKSLSDFALWTGGTPTAGTVTSNYTIPMVIAGYTVRVLVAYP